MAPTAATHPGNPRTRAAPPHALRAGALAVLLAGVAACGAFSDPATRLAHAIELNAAHLPAREGATWTIRYRPPARLARDGDTWSVQVDRVGAPVVWYRNAQGRVIDSGSTSYHARFVDTPRTWIVDKAGSAELDITLRREQGRAVIVDVE